MLREAIGVDAVEVIQAAVRDPGGAWGPVADVLRAPEIANGNPLATAISDTGEALIAVALQPSRLQIRVARRAPGGAFGAPQTLFTARTDNSREPTVQAGMSASGEAVVAWSFRSRVRPTRELWAAVAAPGAAFGAPVRIGEVQLGAPFALAVGPGGHALLAFASGGQVHVAERAPRTGFAASGPVGRAVDAVAVLPVAALDATGGAVVARQRVTDWGVEAVVRAGPGPFGAPATLARPVRLGLSPDLMSFFTGFALADEGEYATGDAGPDSEAAHPRALVVSAGRALLTWAGPASRDGVWSFVARSATLPLAGGAAETRAHGAGVRDADSVTPLGLADGGAAALWSDDVDERDSRLHLAVEGAAVDADPPGPRVRIRPLSKRVLGGDDALVLRVTCSAACEVRAQTGTGLTGANGTLARRDGDDVIVTWRTTRDADPDTLFLFATANRDTQALSYAEPRGGPRRFRARLRDARQARYVSIFVSGETVASLRRTQLRVRG